MGYPIRSVHFIPKQENKSQLTRGSKNTSAYNWVCYQTQGCEQVQYKDQTSKFHGRRTGPTKDQWGKKDKYEKLATRKEGPYFVGTSLHLSVIDCVL